MTIEQAICERLESLASVTALVSTRVYQLKLPQRPTLPAIRVQQVSELEDFNLRGPEHLLTTRVQVDAYAQEASGGDPYADATALARVIHGDGLGPGATGLSGWVGDLGGSPVTVHVALIVRVSRMPMYEAEELRLVRIRQDYRVQWWEL